MATEVEQQELARPPLAPADEQGIRHAMTAPHVIDPARFLSEQLEQASPAQYI